MIKKYYLVSILLLTATAVYGMIVPALISAKSDEAVVGGIVLGVGLVPLFLAGLVKIFTKKEEKK